MKSYSRKKIINYKRRNQNNRSRKLFSMRKKGGNIPMPTFHVLIATGGRTTLKRMLDSLRDQLLPGDAVTIVFDGPEALKKSTMTDDWLVNFKCPVKKIEQNPALGYWGHEARNVYQSKLTPKTTFIMHGDDDDIYVNGTFDKLRSIIKDPSKLYIARMTNSANYSNRSQYTPKNHNLSIRFANIGTPCGIIPFDKAGESKWGHHYGGDFSYYDGLKDKVSGVEFIDVLLYKIK